MDNNLELIEQFDKDESDYFNGLNGEVSIFPYDHGEDFKVIVQTTSETLLNLQQDFELRLLDKLKGIAEKTGRNYDKILDYLKTHNLTRPSFLVFDNVGFDREIKSKVSREVNEIVLRDPKFDNEDNDSLYVVMNLPKPVAYWWEKGVGDWGSQGEDLKDQVLSWGSVYRDTMNAVWENINYVEGVDVERLNDVAEHKPFEYYYIWKIEKSKYKKLELLGQNGEKIIYEIDYSKNQSGEFNGVVDIEFDNGSKGSEISVNGQRCPRNTKLLDGSTSYGAHIPSTFLSQVIEECKRNGIEVNNNADNEGICPCKKSSIYGEEDEKGNYYDEESSEWKAIEYDSEQ